MAARDRDRLVTNLQYWLFAAITVLAGVCLFYVSGTKWGKSHESIASLLNQMGGLLIASVAVATLWDLFGRQSLLREVLNVVKLNDSVVSAGLESVGLDYNKAIDWDERLTSAKELDVFAAWATTWRNTHQAKLSALATRSGAKIRVCIPDPQNDACVDALATRFNRGQDEVRSKLEEAIEDYKRFDGSARSGRVEIYTTPVYRAFSAYRIDELFVVTLYHHKESRSGSVPVFVFRKDKEMFDFFRDDLEGVLAGNATKVYP
ncbi:hypothetical protein [Actinomadura decatromicini]|uniref:Uncharacterized protein n=1 Tax=Actinomadura decatromicini TaxID=2604572 RepID=A0A5D3FRL0_9ACTN|nr:hypothetical protein [Actinomadura decatromicini]TYK50739.1 hypothetical protein FXF68_09660 [Actinomadura decatromicini]